MNQRGSAIVAFSGAKNALQKIDFIRFFSVEHRFSGLHSHLDAQESQRLPGLRVGLS